MAASISQDLNISPNIERMLERVAGLTPKAVMEAMDDVEVLQRSARADLMVQMGYMRRLAASPSFTVTNRLQYIGALMRISGAAVQEEKPPTADKLPRIVINIPNYGAEQQNQLEKRVFPAIAASLECEDA